MLHMKAQSFIKGALIISVGGIAAKILGAFYRIPLTNFLGGEGMGVYQMVYPLYCLLLTVSATGIPAGLARAVSRAEAVGESSSAVLRRALGLFSLVGLCGSAWMFALAGPMSAAQGEPGAAMAYRVLAPSVLLVSVISCFRGWFQGRSNFYPTAVSELVEQAVKVGLGLFFAYTYRADVYTAVSYALLSVTCGELAACAFMLARAAGERGRRALYKDVRAMPSAASLLRITVPVTVAAGILPLSGVIDSVLITRLLSRYTANATALYGLYSGAAAALANLPASVCYGLAAASIPSVSANYAKGDAEAGQKSVLFAIKCTMFLAVPAAAFLLLFAPQICAFVFPSVTGAEGAVLARLVRILAPSSLLLAVVQTLSACLTGRGLAKYSALAMAAAVSVKLILEAVLLQSAQISVFGAAYATNACYLVALLVDLYYSITERKLRARAFGYFSVFALAAAAAMAAAWPLRGVHILLAAAAAGCAYLLIAAVAGFFGARELRFAWRKKHDYGRRTGL